MGPFLQISGRWRLVAASAIVGGMIATIIALNSGEPSTLEWEGRSVSSSMLHHSVPGPLVVHKHHIDGNSFGSPLIHGLEHAVLYAFGITSALEFVKRLGMNEYVPGTTGENVTLDSLDEQEISVGDKFEFGEVLAEATNPRIPCSKVSLRMRHSEGQKAMQQCGRSGIYFRILRPGKIFRDSPVRRVELAKHRFPIAELYAKMVAGTQLSPEEIQRALANGAFPRKMHEKWTATT